MQYIIHKCMSFITGEEKWKEGGSEKEKRIENRKGRERKKKWKMVLGEEKLTIQMR